MDVEKSTSMGEVDIDSIPFSPLIFVRKRLLWGTLHTRDAAIEPFSVEQCYLSLFFVFKDTLAMMLLFLCMSLAGNPKM